MWEKWGLKDNPYSQNPIDEHSLNLFIGRKKEVSICRNSLSGKNSRFVIEGGRGVGTTSLGNYVRYTLAAGKKEYLTPDMEISVGRNWNQELLLSNVLSAAAYTLERRNPRVIQDDKFQKIKRTTQVIEEKFKSFGGQAFGFGGQYGQSSTISYPALVPVSILIQHMKELFEISKDEGYHNGIIVHLNNLDVNTVFQPNELKNFLNEARDSFQIKGYHWFFVGDTGLRGFIGSNVDRLDDIITSEVRLNPLSLEEVCRLIDKRSVYYRTPGAKIALPIDFEVIKYLYGLTNGRLRYIFGICTRLLSLISGEPLLHMVDLKFAKPIIMKFAEDRIAQQNISPLSLSVLRKLVKLEQATTTELTKKMKKEQTSISRSLRELLNKRLVTQKRSGRNNVYSPSLDAKVAYSI
ncbi:MAG: BlaI/MecI/CopY family transcriptional regulator [Candidatus Omnitrophica bacterium]|nr:BlaI/MecI/CopY family transcriptional regulator [Candidatus Omnitrophota bacterium]